MPANRPTHVQSEPRDSISLALEDLLSRYAVLLEQTIQRHGLSPTDMDDVLQDVRIRLWRALVTGERIAKVPASYLRRTARSATVDFIRKQQTGLKLLLRAQPERAPAIRSRTPETATERSEVSDRVIGAIDRLSPSRRVPVRMYLLGYSRKEIELRLGWTEAKTRNLLYRGLADLREELAKDPLIPSGLSRSATAPATTTSNQAGTPAG